MNTNCSYSSQIPIIVYDRNNAKTSASHIETSIARIKFTNNTVSGIIFLQSQFYYCIQVSGWPGKQISIPIELVDEASQLASGFTQLEPVDYSNKVSMVDEYEL